jgi:hypothetical protein
MNNEPIPNGPRAKGTDHILVWQSLKCQISFPAPNTTDGWMIHRNLSGSGGRARFLRAPTGNRDRGPLEMADISDDYYVFTSRRGEHPERWSWEIRRKSKPLGIRFTADGFQSEAAAQFSGRKALEEFLIELSKEERRSPK